MKTCIACGMPMTKPSDYPLQDESKDYCIYCARPDGSMQSYPEKLEGTVRFLIRTQGIDEKAARELAVRTLAKLPAWKAQTP
ncbi:zinc ribbon domain-containing protein [Caproiciproducens sp. R1]|uniref:zinc ribbon domain-containing protein n=1 Tax=Caproiciproducens sp. R1 TaxID=3435000 RepID=UPI004033825A